MINDPREFSSFDDAPTNTGFNERDWDEVRPRSLRFNDDEIDPDENEDDREDQSNYEGDFE